jgi:nucleotide-binding universal stress UspA family protein
MQVFRSTAILAPYPRRSVSAKTLRMWCAPEIILGVTTLSDEQTLLPHIINQARQSGAKIILAHAHYEPGTRKCRRPSPERPSPSIRETREAMDRIARQLRWLGFTCEPVLLSGPPELEIPRLVRSFGVDRVLLGFEEDPDLATKAILPIPGQVLRGVDVPVCAIGRNAIHASRTAVRNITLAVSAESRSEVPLSFACRLAQENRAKLNVLHVFESRSDGGVPPTPQCVVANLPFTTWREAELFCPTEVTVREGEPVEQILNHCASTQQDLIVLCSPGNTRSEESWRGGVSYRTIAGARCPVIIAKADSDAAVAISISGESAPRKFAPEVEEMNKKQRKEAIL